MTTLTREALQPLLLRKSGPCLSLYIPTHRRYPDTEQDPIRFRNALREAERLLSARLGPDAIRELLDPVTALPNTEFWRHQSEGLAVLRAPDVLTHFRVPQPMPERVVVADSFHLRPLIRCLQSNDRYHLVALTQQSVRVFEGVRDSLTPRDLAGLPDGVADFASERRGAGAQSAHTAARGDGGRRVHAAGGSANPSEEELTAYFRAIDRVLTAALRHERTPVLLAGVEYYLPMYRAVSRLENLADVIVPGSPDAMSLEELRTRAWPVAEGLLRRNETQALDLYRRAGEQGRTSETLEDIVRRAGHGGIRRLFLAAGARVWGTVDPASGAIHRTEAQQNGVDDDLLDDVAEAVFSHGGQVVTLPQDRMPGGREVAAELG